MSIATEITRLQTAKADLKTAIEGKGVTVPSATLIDSYADLVDAIQTGGGGSVGSLVNYIEFIPTTEYNSNNKASVQFDALADTVILVHIDSFPDTSETETPGLFWTNLFHGSVSAGVGQGFLRVNGTIGSDNGWCGYNRTNGVISLGGSYGKLYPGSKYHIYQFGLTTQGE